MRWNGRAGRHISPARISISTEIWRPYATQPSSSHAGDRAVPDGSLRGSCLSLPESRRRAIQLSFLSQSALPEVLEPCCSNVAGEARRLTVANHILLTDFHLARGAQKIGSQQLDAVLQLTLPSFSDGYAEVQPRHPSHLFSPHSQPVFACAPLLKLLQFL